MTGPSLLFGIILLCANVQVHADEISSREEIARGGGGHSGGGHGEGHGAHEGGHEEEHAEEGRREGYYDEDGGPDYFYESEDAPFWEGEEEEHGERDRSDEGRHEGRD
ncbi:MAG: hypothetical protein ACHQT8_04830 [Chlamydiales bacterium]